MKVYYAQDFFYQPSDLIPTIICTICDASMNDLFITVATHLEATHDLYIPNKSEGLKVKERVLRPSTNHKFLIFYE